MAEITNGGLVRTRGQKSPLPSRTVSFFLYYFVRLKYEQTQVYLKLEYCHKQFRTNKCLIFKL